MLRKTLAHTKTKPSLSTITNCVVGRRPLGRLTLVLLTVVTVLDSGFAQDRAQTPKFLVARFDSSIMAYIIPDCIFASHPDFLQLPPEVDTTGSFEKQGYEIRWPSTFLDGNLVLKITKKQIYLKSSHDNPNPDHLYWIAQINDEQFKIVETKIKSDTLKFRKEPSHYLLYDQLFYTRFKAERGIPRRWTKKKQAKYYQGFLNRKYQNTDDLIGLFDDGLTLEKLIPFMIQEDFDGIDPVLLANSIEEYNDSLPENFTPLKVLKDQ